MKKTFFALYLLLFFSAILNAQQTGLYTHFFYKPMLYNPAFTGMGGNINAMIINRSQFSGFSGAPVSNTFTLDGKVGSKKVGLGVNIIDDKQNLTGRIGGTVLYSYSLHLSKHTRLNFGISLGVINYSLNYSNAIVANNNDPLLSTGAQNKIALNSSAGMALYGKRFEFGLSIPQLLAPQVKYATQSGTTAYYQQATQYMGYYKYKYFISEEQKISLSPMLLVNFTPNTPVQLDAGINFNWKNKFWVGTVYKSGYAVSGIAGFRLYKRLDVGYSYDFVLGNLSKYAGIANEIMLSYTFGKIVEEEKDSTATDSTGTTKKSNLNDLLLKKLLAEIDAVFENPNATKEDYKVLRDKISEFSDSHFIDPTMRKMLKDYIEKLSEDKPETDTHVTVKGQISLPGKDRKAKSDFSGISIKLIDKETGTEIGNYTPRPRNGKYILILKPGDKYVVKVEKDGFQTFKKEMAPAIKKQSYEIKQVIKLKKMKVVKTKAAKPGTKK